jgi:cytochrome b subunit of formate dehydrogenase
MPLSSHTDRAKGFTLVTMPLAAATGFVVLLIALSAFGVPVLSVAALLLALAGFSVAWLVALLFHIWVSADGALVLHTIFLWRMLLLEARERRKRYGKR